MFRSIIVPLDGSAFGDHALPYGIALARRTGATLKLLHVHNPYLPGELLEPLPTYQLQRIADYDRMADEDARRDEVERLWDFADRLTADGILTTAHVLTGPVAPAIADFARNAADGLIVMTTHGRSGFQRLRLGSVADAVVRHGSTPVLLVRSQSEAPTPFDEVELARVLVPVDGSPFSTAIVRPLASLAGSERMSVTFFEAAPPSDGAATLSPIWPYGTASAPARQTDEFLEGLLHDLPVGFAEAGAKRVISLNPPLAILEEAATGDYDFIAMATHGRGGAHHLLLGSTADKVMRGTDKPLLLYRPDNATRTTAAEHAMEESVLPQVRQLIFTE